MNGPEATDPSRHLALIGMMGSGKTTVGRIVAQQLGVTFVDTDARIVAEQGRSISAIFEEDGEAAFRAIESAQLMACLAAAERSVISLGGGVILAEANRDALRAGSVVVWLRATVATLVSRVGSGANRPLIAEDPVGRIARIDAARRELYESAAHVVIDVDDLRSTQVADGVRAAFTRWTPAG